MRIHTIQIKMNWIELNWNEIEKLLCALACMCGTICMCMCDYATWFGVPSNTAILWTA